MNPPQQPLTAERIDTKFDANYIGEPGKMRLYIPGFVRNLKIFMDEGNFDQAKGYADMCGDMLLAANQSCHDNEVLLASQSREIAELREQLDSHQRGKESTVDAICNGYGSAQFEANNAKIFMPRIAEDGFEYFQRAITGRGEG